LTGPATSAAAVAQLALLGEALVYAEQVAVFVWDDDRHYVAVNDFACRLVGLTREELLGRRVGFASPDIEAKIADVQRHAAQHGTSSFVRADGATIALEWVTFRTRIAGLPYMASVCWPASEPA
jgi:PAS domain S-box-containing protein